MKNTSELDFLNHLIDPSQNSEAWHNERTGRFTSSLNYRLIPSGKRDMTDEELSKRPKTGAGSRITTILDDSILGEGANTYVLEKVAETLTGHSIGFSNSATEWGSEHEGEARIEYERKAGVATEVIGFRTHEDDAGGTVDGLVISGEKKIAVLETKCPFNSLYHIEYMMNIKDAPTLKAYKPQYYWQIVSNMIIMNVRHGTFVSYDPRFPEPYRMHIAEINYISEDAKLMRKKLKIASQEKSRILNEHFNQKQNEKLNED